MKNSLKLFLVSLILLFISENSHSRSFVDSTSLSLAEKDKKISYLTFQFDIGLKPFSICYNDNYKGEYFDDANDKWIWKDSDTSDCSWIDKYNYKHYKFNILLSVYKNLNVGFSYQGIIMTRRWDGASFFMMSAVVEYTCFFNKTKGTFAYGAFSLGNYQTSDSKKYVGKGSEIFTELKLGAGILLKNRLGIKLWFANDYLYYYEKSNSVIFNKAQKFTANWNMLQIGLGFSYNFFLIPDNNRRLFKSNQGK